MVGTARCAFAHPTAACLKQQRRITQRCADRGIAAGTRDGV